MAFTSVSGHLLNYQFVGLYRKWTAVPPLSLFDAPVEKFCPPDYLPVLRTLESEARKSQILIIWTDCDREGENIGHEIIKVCQAVNGRLDVYRARFSDMTGAAVFRAMRTLARPDALTSAAVDCRQELDLKIGAAFTRFQTLRLQQVFRDHLREKLISYGSCQFPTLGFVVERFKQVEEFVPEDFWKLLVRHTRSDEKAEFTWARHRLFDQLACQVLLNRCLESPTATVISVNRKEKRKWRPQPLETVELEKLASRKLRIGAKETMTIAERLYTKGYISYPRTETNKFPPDLDLSRLVEMQTQNPDWGEFAQQILTDGGPRPRNGNKSDQAHPPIHPTQYVDSLAGNEKRIYEFIVRHFLACISADALGMETKVEIDVAEERFTAQGLVILELNYLAVYPYDRWSDKAIPDYQEGETFQPDLIGMDQGETIAPPLLTEADLIALMEKHGIGTDATHADHIETIKDRLYVGVQDDGRFVPGYLGMGLVEGYDAMGYEMSKPYLRAALEADLRAICEGRKNKDAVLAEQLGIYKRIFEEALRQCRRLDEALAPYFGAAGNAGAANAAEANGNAAALGSPIVTKCESCGADMTLRERPNGRGYMVGCLGFPSCKEVLWLPAGGITDAQVTGESCARCSQRQTQLVTFTLRPSFYPCPVPTTYTGCITCDPDLRQWFQLDSSPPFEARIAPQNEQTASTARVPVTSRRPAVANSSQESSRASARQRNAPPVSRRAPNVRESPENRRAPAIRNARSAGSSQPSAHNRPPAPAPAGASSNFSGATQGAANAIVCQCGIDAALRTVRKQGPNVGRQFYVCSQAQQCNFFLWADSGGASGGASDENNAGAVAALPQCRCGFDSRLATVVKAGPNNGKAFYACAKPMSESGRCNFFQWANEDQAAPAPSTQAPLANRDFGNAGGRVTLFPPRGRGNGPPPKRRKCGICREEGHNAKNCTNR